MKKDSIGDRMKSYEKAYGANAYVLPRMPTIIRVDGKAFHTFTKNMQKPFDKKLMICMNETGIALCEQIQNAKIAYIQSDEISILLNDYVSFQTQQWFRGEIQKMVSISSAIASTEFLLNYLDLFCRENEGYITDLNISNPPKFDSRVFNIPKEDVCNMFLWRQQDWERNSITMLARSYYSHKEMHQKSCLELKQMMLEEHDVCWEKLPTSQKRGRCIIYKDNKWQVDNEIPLFKENRDYIEQHI